MKKRPMLDSIGVKTPCTQDWNRMYGNDEVRFCEHCVKQVHDLSAMTRKKAEEFVAGAKGSVCVRYVKRPGGKMQTAGDKLYQISGRASRLAAGVFGASLTLASSAYAQTVISPLPSTRETVVKADKQTKDTPKEHVADSIYGTVTDPNGAVVTGAKVTLTDEKNGAQQSVSSNDDGYYIFSDIKAGAYALTFESPGFRTYVIQNIDFNNAIGAKYDVIFKLGDIAIMGDMAVAVNYENQLVLAVQDNDIERVKRLIARGINVNEKDSNLGITALQVAARQGKVSMVEVLLNAGARVNLRDESGRTAIMMIADDYYSDEGDRGDNEDGASEDSEETKSRSTPATEIFTLLIGHGAKVNLRDSQGMTALMLAAQGEEPELLRLLIAHGAAIDIQAKNGRTALMEAVDDSELENIKILLEAGAEVNLKDDEGETALTLCSDSDIEQLLLSYGARQEVPKPDDNL